MHGTASLVGIALILVFSQAAVALPIVGVSANTVPQGEFMLDTWFMWRDYTTQYDELVSGGETAGMGWVELPSDVVRTHGTIAPRLYYGLADWLTIRVGVPIEDRYVDLPGGGSGSATGLGDLVIDPKIQVYRGESGYPRAAILTGIRFPTGDSEGSPSISDGSTDFVLGAVATHKMGDVSAHACVTFWVNGESAAGVDVPDLWVGVASIESPVDEGWSLLWEAKAYISSDDSTYRRVYVCPGIEWSGDHLTLGASGFVPVYRRGVFNSPRAFDFDWAPYVRVYYRFF